MRLKSNIIITFSRLVQGLNFLQTLESTSIMPAGADKSYGEVGVPPKCNADFCLIPLGTADASVSKYIAEVQRLVRGHPDVKDGTVSWTMHSAGTTLEGPWHNVMTIIGQAHQILHDQGVKRVQTDVRIGSRTDKKQTAKDKVDVVEKLLAGDAASSSGAEEPGMRHDQGSTTDAPNATNMKAEVSGVIPDQ